MSTYVSVVISPATTTRPVVISVSQATRPVGSPSRTASRTASETWSAILSGWPSVTDSDVNENSRAAMWPPSVPGSVGSSQRQVQPHPLQRDRLLLLGDRRHATVVGDDGVPLGPRRPGRGVDDQEAREEPLDVGPALRRESRGQAAREVAELSKPLEL